MAFRLDVSLEALADVDAIAGYILERGSSKSAAQWFNGIIDAIRSLSELPNRCPVADESEHLQREVRLLLHGKRNRRYKVYLAIQ
jgi:plasmid stabilization system protein ParE